MDWETFRRELQNRVRNNPRVRVFYVGGWCGGKRLQYMDWVPDDEQETLRMLSIGRKSRFEVQCVNNPKPPPYWITPKKRYPSDSCGKKVVKRVRSTHGFFGTKKARYANEDVQKTSVPLKRKDLPRNGLLFHKTKAEFCSGISTNGIIPGHSRRQTIRLHVDRSSEASFQHRSRLVQGS